MIRKLVVLIFVAVLCLSSCGNKNAVTSFTENTDDGLTIEEIWEIKDQYDFVYEMDMYLAGKCNYGDEIQKLILCEPAVRETIVTHEGDHAVSAAERDDTDLQKGQKQI